MRNITLEKHQLEDQQDALVVDNLQEASDKVLARNLVGGMARKESQVSFQAENRPYVAGVGPFAHHAVTLEDNQVVLPNQGTEKSVEFWSESRSRNLHFSLTRIPSRY